jgi:hypothetical protein
MLSQATAAQAFQIERLRAHIHGFDAIWQPTRSPVAGRDMPGRPPAPA